MERAQTGVRRAVRVSQDPDDRAASVGATVVLDLLEQPAIALMVAELVGRVHKVTVLMEIGLNAQMAKVVQPGSQRLQATVLQVTVPTAAVVELEDHVHPVTVLTATDHVLQVTVPTAVAEVLTIEVAHHGSPVKVETAHTQVGQVGIPGNKTHRRRTCRRAGVVLHEGVRSRLG